MYKNTKDLSTFSHCTAIFILQFSLMFEELTKNLN
jgi:hypothetical protein